MKTKVPMESLIALGSDGPNVNKTIFREVSIQIKDTLPNWSCLLDIDTCNLHTMHNAFSKGISEYGQEAEDLAIALFGLFKISSGRREDYKDIQLDLDLPEELFIKHTEVRWLSIGPALERIVRQWPGIKAYVSNLEKNSRTVPKSINFKLIKKALQRPDTKVKLLFLLSVIPLFEEFLQDFQAEVPMIHLLYSRMTILVTKIMRRFIKAESVNNATPDDLKTFDFGIENQLSDKDIVLGEARMELSNMKSEAARHKEILGIRAFYVAVAKYLVTRLPFQNKLIRSVGCLSPIRRYDKESVYDVEILARELHFKESVIVNIVDEWKVYQTEDELKEEKKLTITGDKYSKKHLTVSSLNTGF